jgi:hypothetical protein
MNIPKFAFYPVFILVLVLVSFSSLFGEILALFLFVFLPFFFLPFFFFFFFFVNLSSRATAGSKALGPRVPHEAVPEDCRGYLPRTAAKHFNHSLLWVPPPSTSHGLLDGSSGAAARVVAGSPVSVAV